MKRTIFLLIAAIFALSAVSAPKIASAAPQVVTSGDSLFVIADGDTMAVLSSSGIKAALGDTVWDAVSALTIEETSDEYDLARLENEKQMDELIAMTVANVVTVISVSLVVIVFIVLLFFYLRRRAKYRVIQRAIDANYQLPQGIFGGNTYVNNYPQPASQPAASQPAPQSAEAGSTPPPLPGEQPADNPMSHLAATGNGKIDWNQMRGSFTLIASCFGVMLFFLILGVREMAAIMLIPILIGAARVFISYQSQRQR